MKEYTDKPSGNGAKGKKETSKYADLCETVMEKREKKKKETYEHLQRNA